MRRLHLLLLLMMALTISAHEDILLNDGWAFRTISDPNWTVKDVPVTLPHTWNANYVTGTYYNRETMVYSRELEVTEAMQGKRLLLYFEGVNSVADVYVNRQTVGQHKGGYTAFCLEITDAVKPGKNDLQVWVSNAFRTDVLPISGDFNVYGGIHRPCHLIVTEQDCISPLFYASPGVLVHQDKVTEQQAEITVETILSLKSGKQGLKVRTTVLDAQGKVVNQGDRSLESDGNAVDQGPVPLIHIKHPMTITKPTLWNGQKNPYLYNIKIELLDGSKVIDEQTVQTGFRYFSVDKDKGFFLNGQHYDLHGFNRHEDVEGKGSALTQEDYNIDMQLIKESGATMLRLAHYPHAEPIYKLCDEAGMVVWSEIPMCGPGGYNFTGYLHNPGLEDNARQAALEMVYQKFNHPSVCFWGIFNEILVTDTRFKAYDNPVNFVKEINALYKQTDPSRLTTFATCVPHTHYLGCSDLIAWNKYFRRPGNEQQVRDFYAEARQTAEGQPLGISEYGDAGSIYQHYDPLYDKAKTHAENYQTLSHEGYWRAIKDSEWLWCKTIWQFSDMQTSIRREGDRDGMNDKGMVTYDRKTRKDIFYFYKANWTREPMLYLTDRRFTERTHAVTDIKAYGNVAQATLYVNNKKIGTAKRDDICRLVWPKVTLSPGDNQIRIEYKKGKTVLSDTCTWHLQEPVPEAIAPIEAPFDMPQLQRPQFPNRSIVAGENIQKAIDDLAAQGGGTVIVPRGKWQTGRITLRSNINLHLEEGAELHFSGEVADYLPAVLTRYEGIDMYSLGAMIYANGAENIALTGKGKLVAPPRDCEISRRQDGGVSESINDIPLELRIFDGQEGQKTFMPLFFGPMYCKNILVEGVTFEQSLFWNIAPTYCENIIIRDVTVNSFGVGRTDGIDIDSSVNTLIEYVTLDCGDDCFTLKSGRSYDGVRKNRPTENVVIRHCRVKRGVGGIAIGSETAAIIRNVYMHDCVMENAKFPVFIKTRRTRGGGSENVWLERIHIQRTENAAFYWDMLGSAKWVGELANRLPARPINELTPVFRNFHFKDITVDKCGKLVSARGLPERPITDVTFENIQSLNRTMTMIDTDNWTFK